MKKAQGGTGANQYVANGQNVHLPNTAESIAQAHGVTERTPDAQTLFPL